MYVITIQMYLHLKHKPEEVQLRKSQIVFLYALEDRKLMMRGSDYVRCNDARFDADRQSFM
jgi:hypothetical protein